MILAIDPGTEESAYVLLTFPDSTIEIIDKGKVKNDTMLTLIERYGNNLSHTVIEMVASYGMPVGKSTFETVYWIGRFCECAFHSRYSKVERIFRKSDVCMHLCHTTKAKDSNIRQALIDRYGEPGTKNSPGLLYGISNDVWSALAIGVTYRDRMKGK